jgi:hypothetical protein
MDKIPLISEIEPSDIIDKYWYKVYPTRGHREKDLPWVFLGRDLRLEIEKRSKFESYLIWGK